MNQSFSSSSLDLCPIQFLQDEANTLPSMVCKLLQPHQNGPQEGGDHLFSAIFKSSSPTARGGNYLRQHLYEELLAQQRKSPADLVSALHNSIAELNKGFQSLHPFNLDVLQGLRVVVAFVDFKSQKLLVASNGGCRQVFVTLQQLSS